MPWEDLRYLVGEIIYGGHVVEGWDRRLASAYLHRLLCEGAVEGAELAPGFAGPPPSLSHAQVRRGGVGGGGSD